MLCKVKKVVVAGLFILSFGNIFIPSLVSGMTYANSVNYEKTKKVNLKITDLGKKRVDLMLKLNNEISFNALGLMELELSDDLLNKYDLSEDDVKDIKAVLNSYNDGVWEIKSRAVFEDYHLILDKDDIAMILYVANTVGPAGIAAALAAMYSVIPGAGTVVAGVIGFFGASTIIANASYAILTNRRLKLGLTGVSVVD